MGSYGFLWLVARGRGREVNVANMERSWPSEKEGMKALHGLRRCDLRVPPKHIIFPCRGNELEWDSIHCY